MKVYALFQSAGTYEDYRNILIGIYVSKEAAQQKGLELDAECIVTEKDFIMPRDVYSSLHYGYGSDGNTLVAKGGYSVADFEIMEKQTKLVYAEYHPCTVEEFDVIE